MLRRSVLKGLARPTRAPRSLSRASPRSVELPSRRVARPMSTGLRASLARRDVSFTGRKSVSPSRFAPAEVKTPSRSFVEWSTATSRIGQWTSNEELAAWVLDRMRLLQPDAVHLCDGSEEENKILCDLMVAKGTLIRLNPKLRPNSFLARSPPDDVARVEERTYICSENESDAGFTNNWRDPEEVHTIMEELYRGCMRGRTMYVIPFCMGPLSSPFSVIGVQITDSPYVVASMRLMTRMGDAARLMLEEGDREFIPCLHSVGVPLKPNQEDSPWPCNNEKWIVHFPEQRRIWSFGSNYGGNALLGKKCFALRIASSIAREEGWLAEHMLIVGITNPEGVKRYVAAAFPSACGKTNLAMLNSTVPGWKLECVGDDIAWIRIGEDGRLWATNPEAGFFGVAPGTSMQSNPNAMASLKENSVFTNVAMTLEGDVWWEGMTEEPPKKLVSWLRTEWTAETSGVQHAAHPNSRFTCPASQCPVIDSEWESPQGVPIDAIIFGGRRSSSIPLVYQAKSWEHGVFMGATMSSETTAAAAGKRGVLRSDPFAMRPFCGYNMADYFGHWLSFKDRMEPSKLPKIFHVNWFRKSRAGKFMWPGFGENIRVLEWILERSAMGEDMSNAKESAIGIVPTEIDTKGLDIEPEVMEELLRVTPAEMTQEVTRSREFFNNFGDRIPDALWQELSDLEARIEASDN